MSPHTIGSPASTARARVLVAVVLGIFVVGASAQPRRRGFVTSATRRDEEGVLNIHLVPHTHDDAGWLKTVDQYYYGANNSIQVAGVQYILDSVVTSLAQNPDRKFVYCEVSFFSRWWAEQDDQTRALVRRLIKDGQLSFVNGGYVQHDEAAAHYVAMIDQTTRGHQWLTNELGHPPPRVGWQIDPFGHSRTHSSMMASGAGMDALFFGRIHHQDLAERKKNRELEMMWRGGSSLGSDGDVFAGVFYSGNYGMPPGFNWDHGSRDAPMQDDPCLADYNVEQRLVEFIFEVEKIARWTLGPDVMLTMGSDFHYSNANHWFKNLDSLVHHLNAHPEFSKRYNIFYSTPETYVASKHTYKDVTWPEKEGDFFPYADCPWCYWAGYFTSKAASKRYVRGATSYLQAARHLEALAAKSSDSASATTDSLEEAVSLLQHHDGVTGTAKQHVVNDYHRRIAMGWAEARKVVAVAVNDLLGSPLGTQNASLGGVASQTSYLGECPLLNVSVCSWSVTRVAPGGPGVELLLYNPLAWRRSAPIRVPIGDGTAIRVSDAAGQPVPAQIVPVPYDTLRLQQQEAPGQRGLASREVAFVANLEPLAFSIFRVTPVEDSAPGAATESEVHQVSGGSPGSIHITNGLMSIHAEAADGSITELRNTDANISTPLSHQLLWYRSHLGQAEGPGEQNPGSGAYIFRPVAVHNVSGSGLVLLQVVKGPIVNEIRQSHSSWASVTHRLWKGESHVEVDWTVGPIPIEDGLGREVVSRWSTGLGSGDHFWTDANGREMMKRTLNVNTTQPVAANFYPVTATAALSEDGDVAREFFVVTDRAQAAASLRPGQLELMVHRRTTKDDCRGVGEPLDETTCNCHDCECTIAEGLTILGTHLLGLQPAGVAARARRELQQLANDPPLLIFTSGVLEGVDGWSDVRDNQPLRLLPRSEESHLPPNVHLLTLRKLEPTSADGGSSSSSSSSKVLVRLAHLYETGEGQEGLGEAACIDLEDLLGPLAEVAELSLTGVAPRNLQERRQWGSAQRMPLAQTPGAQEACQTDANLMAKKTLVTLGPMQIKTFQVTMLAETTTAVLDASRHKVKDDDGLRVQRVTSFT